jgi:hypothetical protein
VSLPQTLTSDSLQLLQDKYRGSIDKVVIAILEMASFFGESPEYFAAHAIEYKPRNKMNLSDLGVYLINQMRNEEYQEDSFRFRAKAALAHMVGDFDKYEYFSDGKNIYVVTSEQEDYIYRKKSFLTRFGCVESAEVTCKDVISSYREEGERLSEYDHAVVHYYTSFEEPIIFYIEPARKPVTDIPIGKITLN